MQFYHPEVLYALVLLIIPILVHLFQLRRFKTEYFTNVKFLKKISLQTRKSSRVKKWLVLASRLLALAAMILAFAQPYFPSRNLYAKGAEMVIFLDNSYSMEAFGKKGKLLERSIQELLESDYINKNVSLFTNSGEYKDPAPRDLQAITYSGNITAFKTAILKAENSFSKDTSARKKFLIISDFQQELEIPSTLHTSGIDIYTYLQLPERRENLYIDTAFLSSETIESRVLSVKISNSGKNSQSTPVSLFSNNNLIGKTSVSLDANESKQVSFPINDLKIVKGKVQIDDNSLQFDNSLYFSLNLEPPTKVYSIGSGKGSFLERIYTAPDFQFNTAAAAAIDFNLLNDAEVIILNELPEISGVLLANLSKLISKKKVFIVIPSQDNLGPNFNAFVKNLGVTGFDNKQEEEKLITNIKFQHPIFKDVFDKQVKNFEYPKVQMNYQLKARTNTILALQDNHPFLFQQGNAFIFSAPLNPGNTNFTQSPLVVPTFYKMAMFNKNTPTLYQLLGRENRITLPIATKKDEIVKLNSEKISFIPLQKNLEGKVVITTNELPEEPGNYLVESGELEEMGISYNVDRAESNMQYTIPKDIKSIQKINNLEEFFLSEGYENEKNTFWKWFVTFALLFLIVETLLIKYFK